MLSCKCQWVAVLAALGLIVGLGSGPADRVLGQEGAAPGFSLAEFKKLRKVLDLKDQPWATIPWKNTLPEARAQAVKEKKPIFMVVNTGNCLGFV